MPRIDLPWWALPLAAIPLILAKSLLHLGAKVEASSISGEEDWSDARFTCERVCTTPKLLNRMGSAAREATPNNCVTVCGTSGVDACVDACTRAVCVSSTLSHVPKWKEDCMQRCSTECMRTRRTHAKAPAGKGGPGAVHSPDDRQAQPRAV